MSPDLRSAKVFISVFGDDVDARQAYAWLVKASKSIKHGLSQSLKGMKSVPDLHFKQSDVGSAVEVMMTLDMLSRERSTDEEGLELPSGMIDGLDFDDMDEDEDEDDDYEYKPI